MLVFLDDDALMAPGYLAAVQNRAQTNELLALRGRILPKAATGGPIPKQYDLGDSEQPSEFNLEGNMAVRRSLFHKLGGFDPLMFGHEGKVLTHKWKQHFPETIIRYCPDLIIYHDWASAKRLAKKRERQAVGKDYLDYLKEHALNPGVSIILRVYDKLAEAKTFLDGLAKHNTYQPIEVLIWAKDSKLAANLTRPYMAKFFARVLPASTETLSRVIKVCRYDNCMIVDLPTQINEDILSGRLQHKQSDLKTAVVCTKDAVQKLGHAQLSIALDQLANKLGITTASSATATAAPPSKYKEPQSPTNTSQPANVEVNSPQAITSQAKSYTPSKILQAEAQIQQLEDQLIQIDNDINELESRYLPLSEINPEKIVLKDELEEKVIASCRLLIEIKDAKDNLQDLRIRQSCKA